jgi:hypothetical protein
MFAVACQHDDAHLVIGDQIVKCVVQFGDHRFVESIENVGTRHRNLRDAGTALMDFEPCLLGH